MNKTKLLLFSCNVAKVANFDMLTVQHNGIQREISFVCKLKYVGLHIDKIFLMRLLEILRCTDTSHNIS